MVLLFEQNDDRFDLKQRLNLDIQIPITANVEGDLKYNTTPIIDQTYPEFWDGDEWVDMGYGFHKRDNGVVPGTSHKVLTSLPSAAFPGLETTFELTPFALAIARNDGSSFMGMAADDAINPNPRCGFVFAKNTPTGLRWEFIMEGQDQGPANPGERGGSDFRIRSLDNTGPAGGFRTDFEIKRDTGYLRVGTAATGAPADHGGVVFPSYDLVNNPPAVLEVGLTVFNTGGPTPPKGLRTWDGVNWI